jgi:hypothetical protein
LSLGHQFIVKRQRRSHHYPPGTILASFDVHFNAYLTRQNGDGCDKA